jgi:hypothetical protein
MPLAGAEPSTGRETIRVVQAGKRMTVARNRMPDAIHLDVLLFMGPLE